MSRSNWGTSNRREELPKDWAKIRLRVLTRCRYRCEYVGPSGARCHERATDVDHAVNRLDHSIDSLKGLCPEHHKRKTAVESREGKVAKRRKGERKRKDDRPGAL